MAEYMATFANHHTFFVNALLCVMLFRSVDSVNLITKNASNYVSKDSPLPLHVSTQRRWCDDNERMM